MNGTKTNRCGRVLKATKLVIARDTAKGGVDALQRFDDSWQAHDGACALRTDTFGQKLIRRHDGTVLCDIQYEPEFVNIACDELRMVIQCRNHFSDSTLSLMSGPVTISEVDDCCR